MSTPNIDPRWADIDFDKVNAELRDMRAQIERLQAHIDRTQPIQAGEDGYVQPQAQDGQGLKQFLSAAKDAGITHWSDDLTDLLVAISASVADGDDRAAQSMLRETLKLLAEPQAQEETVIDCTPNHNCNGRMVHLPDGEHCDKCGIGGTNG